VAAAPEWIVAWPWLVTGVCGAWSDAELCDVMGSMRARCFGVVSCELLSVFGELGKWYSMLFTAGEPLLIIMSLVSSEQYLQISNILATITWYKT
jgi:hypothetical protein